MKRLSLIVILLAIAAIGLQAEPGDRTVSATYLEDIDFLTAEYVTAPAGLHGMIDSGPDTASTIVRELLGATVGMHSYWLAATDVRGNAATHEALLQTQDPIGITVDEPSSGGFSDRARYAFSITTAQEAVCEWDFASLQDPDYRPMSAAAEGTYHAIQDFESTYRFRENEIVPLIVRCQTPDATESVRVIGTGWTTGPLSFDAALWPVPIADDDDTGEIEATSRLPSVCALDSEILSQTRTSLPGMRHVFDPLPSGYQGLLYSVACTNARGEELQQQELTVRQNFAGDELTIDLLHPSGHVDTQQPVFAVRTNIVARCSQDLGSPAALGPLSDGLQHQRRISLDPGENTGTVTCTAANGATGTLDVSVFVDTSDPVVRMSQSPEVCGGDIIVALSGDDNGDITYVELATDSQRVLRQWPADAEQVTIRQGGMDPVDGADLAVRGVDAAGNRGPVHTVGLVMRADTEECLAKGIQQQLRLLEPPQGVTAADTFAVSIGSELPSTCQWRTTGDFASFDESSDRVHTVAAFHSAPGVSRNAETTIAVQCTDAAGKTVEDSFVIAWDLDEPVIAVSADPMDVSDITEPVSTVSVTADQEVRCAFDDGAFGQEYTTEHVFEASIPYGIDERTVSVTCENRAGKSDTDSVTITESYPSSMTLIVDTPKVSLSGEVSLSVRTSLLASCTARAGEETYVLSSSNDIAHQRAASLDDGTYDILYSCTELSRTDSTAEKIKQLVVDGELPTLTMDSKALSCGLSQYTVLGEVDDNVGVEEVRIAFAGRNYTTDDLPYTIKGLNLTADEIYTLSITVRDVTGNERGPITQEVQAQSAASGACDKEPPRVRLEEDEGNGFVDVWLTCRDDMGCADSYEFGTGGPDGACSFASYSFDDEDVFTINETSKACWRVQDVSGNVVEDDAIVEVEERPDTCFDGVQNGGESDVDCGGPCAPCKGPTTCEDDSDCSESQICGSDDTCWDPSGDTCTEDADCAIGEVCASGLCYAPPPTDGPACTEDNDCASGVCSASNTCETNSCSNGRIDGTETDVDCGGFTCEPCGDGQTCEVRFDCASSNCLSGTCASASCDDGQTNGDETDVDCGGPTCSDRCENGQSCDDGDDCVSGICSSGTCTSTQLQKENPDDFERPDFEGEPTDEGSSLFAIILILLGMTCILGGSGYIYYERSHEDDGDTLHRNTAFEFGEPSFSSPEPQQSVQEQQPRMDFADSKIREEARKKRLKTRKTKRKKLLSEFEGGESEDGERLRIDTEAEPNAQEPVEETEEPIPERDPHNDIGPEQVHQELDAVEDREEIKKRATDMVQKQGADKHEVSSALSDLRAMGRIEDDDVDELRKNLDL